MPEEVGDKFLVYSLSNVYYRSSLIRNTKVKLNVWDNFDFSAVSNMNGITDKDRNIATALPAEGTNTVSSRFPRGFTIIAAFGH